MRYAAAKAFCTRYFVRVKEFAQDGTVDDAFMRRVSNIANEHGCLSYRSWVSAYKYSLPKYPGRYPGHPAQGIFIPTGRYH
jgi:hypothetical protein